MQDGRFPFEVVNGVPVVAAPEEIDITNAPELRSALLEAAAHGQETILVVANLSRFTQYVELDLRHFKGRVPRELIGRTRFPLIGDLPYLLTLGEHAFYWFSLEEPRTAAADALEAAGFAGAAP